MKFPVLALALLSSTTSYALDMRCSTVRPFLADSRGVVSEVDIDFSVTGPNSIGDIRAVIGGEAVKLSHTSATGVTLPGTQGIGYDLGHLADLSNSLTLALPIPVGEVHHNIAGDLRETNPSLRTGVLCRVGFSAF